jgi:hypothetical protein
MGEGKAGMSADWYARGRADAASAIRHAAEQMVPGAEVAEHGEVGE